MATVVNRKYCWCSLIGLFVVPVGTSRNTLSLSPVRGKSRLRKKMLVYLLAHTSHLPMKTNRFWKMLLL